MKRIWKREREQNIFSFFEKHCRQWKEQVFLYEVKGSSSHSKTYGEAWQEASQLASHLATIPHLPGSRSDSLSYFGSEPPLREF